MNEEWGPKERTIKYLEKGHTFMKADSIHGSIGGKLKKEKEVIDVESFVKVCQRASKNFEAELLKVDDFHRFSALNRTNSTKKVKMPKLHDVVKVKFEKGKKTMSCKEFSFTNLLREVDF